MTPVSDPSQSPESGSASEPHFSGLGWPGDVSRETSVAPEPGRPSGLGWPGGVAEDSR
jgi:hypothetical protein